jgi:16S rRNA (cytosine967-C5)-methyltransferase
MKYYSYLNAAVELIRLYDGKQPFHLFIKEFFSRNKKFGSKDRKHIAHLCYCYFRLGPTLENEPIADRILSGLFLCSEKTSEVLQFFKPEWNELIELPIKNKCNILQIDYTELHLFPSEYELSDGIDKASFNLSHLQQPDLFVRIRPGYTERVIKKLDQSATIYKQPVPDCIALPNTTKIDVILDINKEVVVQDSSSQRVSELLSLAGTHMKFPAKVWDCCAASGGKSILAKDILKNIELTVSDSRESILINLKKRFTEAGINHYKSFIADLRKPVVKHRPENYQLIIADVPCSGSGTWGRTPEHLCYFDGKAIDKYCSLQRKIIGNIIPFLQEKGYLLYITCSVFKKENEEIVKWVQEEHRLELVKMEVLKGYTLKADTLFAALLVK